MKVIKYQIEQSDLLYDAMMSYNETNLETVKRVAYNGNYTIEDDGQPEPEKEVTTDDIIDTLLGVSE